MEKLPLINEIRLRLGSPSTSEISESTISVAIDSALGELSRLQPYYRYVELSITSGTSVYPVEDDIMNVRGFWYTPNRPFDTDMQKSMDYVETDKSSFNIGLNTFHSPSLINVLEEKWEHMNRRNVVDWEFNPDSKELMVFPVPTTSGKAVYKGIMKRTLNTVSELYEDAFKDLCRALSMEIYMVKQSSIISIPVGVGDIKYDTRGIVRVSRDLKADAIRKLTGGGSAVVIG
jgi:hypothetical protein